MKLSTPVEALASSGTGKWYVTTYCNRAHYIKSGRPAGHECRIIPPEALALEIEGKYDEAIAIMEKHPWLTL